jgi:hypothetical protein
MEDEQKRVYEAETVGLPPLRMVLVHAENERANRTLRPQTRRRPATKEEQEKQELIIRLIQNLEKE